MGRPSYMRSVVDRNVVVWGISVIFRRTVAVYTEDKRKRQYTTCEQKEEMFSVDTGETRACARLEPWSVNSILTPVCYDICALHVAESYLRIQQFVSCSINFPHFMESEGLLPHSALETCPYPKPDQSSPCLPPQSHFLKINFNIFPSMPGSSKWFLTLSSPHQNPAYTSPLPIRATCPAHHILLDNVTRIILGEGYRSFSSSLRCLLQSPVSYMCLRVICGSILFCFVLTLTDLCTNAWVNAVYLLFRPTSAQTYILTL